MRILVLTRGVPASGKSTWIKDNSLEPYTISSDALRLLHQGPILNPEGELCISQKNDNKVWKLLYELLEARMSRGELCIVDATHNKQESITKYKNLIDKYRYRVIIADFSDIDFEDAVFSNEYREAYKKVPEDVIKKMYENIKNQQLPKCYQVMKPDDVAKYLDESIVVDYDKYEKVVVFGDIHGCHEPLRTYFERNPFSEKIGYIFCGDYIDRGIQNKEVLGTLLSIKDNKNVLLLRGNHEAWLEMYAHNEVDSIRSDTFKDKTIPEIEKIDRRELRQLCRKLAQVAYFSFGDKFYIVTHGGLSNVPELSTSVEQMIKGVGKYEDIDKVSKSWIKNTPPDYVQIHGHRNIFHKDADSYNGRVFNLCSNVEGGDPLRILEISKDGTYEVILEDNPIFDKSIGRPDTKLEVFENATNNQIVDSLNKDKNIIKKILDNDVVSYNFSRDVFCKKIWDAQTCKARGLFIDSKTDKVVARSYDKFFGIDEMEETKMSTLKKSLTFPVKLWRKENGFLGMVSYNPKTDDFFIASKSTNVGDFANMVKEEFFRVIDTEDKKETLKKELREKDITLIFEVINQVQDPHIIKYPVKNMLVLLDAVHNKFETEFLPYEDLQDIGNRYMFLVKFEEYCFHSWDGLKILLGNEDRVHHEGWVIEDTSGFRFKLKTSFYKFWKHMRTIKQRIEKGNSIVKNIKNTEEYKVIEFMESIPVEELKKMSIIDIQEKLNS